MGETSRKPKKGAAKVRHLGRKKNKILRYYAQIYPRTKLRRILRHNGINSARSWAMKNGIIGI